MPWKVPEFFWANYKTPFLNDDDEDEDDDVIRALTSGDVIGRLALLRARHT